MMAFPGRLGIKHPWRSRVPPAMAEKQLFHHSEEVSLSSMISSLEERLSGEIALLKQHLDAQFQQLQQPNSRLRERMDSGASLDASVTSLDRPAAGFHRVISPGESSVVSGPMGVAARPGLGRASTMSSRSRRKTFVRTQMLERHITAKRTAACASVFRGVEDLGASERTWRELLRDVVLSTYFNFTIIGLIIINAALLGVEIDVAAQDHRLHLCGGDHFEVGGFGVQRVLEGFDVLIVVLSVLDIFFDRLAQLFSIDVSSAKGASSVRILRTLRLARIFRGFRITRLFRYFSGLRSLLLSILSTMGSLMWTLLLLLILFYVFSVIFTQLVIDHCRFETVKDTKNPNAIPVCPAELDRYWSNVIESMHTLFSAITGGIDWAGAYVPLKEVSPVAVGLMNLYIVIGFFTILNAIETASADKDIATLKQTQKRMSQASQLTDVFEEFGGDDARLPQLLRGFSGMF
eukprot:Skav204677  [mRNA]  locus=scaffold1284:60854:63249:- [translate_table: standard]